ncbi:MAG TPA: hypothetical protein VFQ45_02660 [Longimicrobium sp.]|nr:hypothetical protein [Longimicrobium sp.]
MRIPRTFPALLLLVLAACPGRDDAAEPADAPASPDTPAAAQTPAGGDEPAQPAWRSNPAEGVTIRPGGEGTDVETGPHTILWQERAGNLEPPYTITATLQKRAGRLHEGYGIVFGGTGLEGPEGGQRYSYFLVRGDGSLLVKLRDGTRTPVVRDWTRDPRVNRDAEEGGRPNRLEVRVGVDEVVFRVNGGEVARVPASELSVRGRAGLRVAHELGLQVREFGVVTGTPPGGEGAP